MLYRRNTSHAVYPCCYCEAVDSIGWGQLIHIYVGISLAGAPSLGLRREYYVNAISGLVTELLSDLYISVFHTEFWFSFEFFPPILPPDTTTTLSHYRFSPPEQYFLYISLFLRREILCVFST